MEEVQTINNTDAKVVASLLGDSNNKVARYIQTKTHIGPTYPVPNLKDFHLLIKQYEPILEKG